VNPQLCSRFRDCWSGTDRESIIGQWDSCTVYSLFCIFVIIIIIIVSTSSSISISFVVLL